MILSIIIVGLLCSIFSSIKFKKIVFINWFFLFVVSLIHYLKVYDLQIVYYILLMLCSIISTSFFLKQENKKYRLTSLIFIVLLFSAIRDMFGFSYYYEFIILQLIITIPILIYTTINAIKTKDYSTLMIIILYILNEVISKLVIQF